MKRIGSSEARAHFYGLLAQAEAGESVIITRRGIVIAKLEPIAGQQHDTQNEGLKPRD